MKKILHFVFTLLPATVLPTQTPGLQAQTITKPIGCFAGTNGTNSAAMAHPDSRGVLLTNKWADVEPTPGNFDFSAIDAKVITVKAAGLKYALAVPAGAFGSPDWLIDNLGADFLSFQYQGNTERLPIWWDSTVQSRLNGLIDALGVHFAQDSSLSHVYISQMTTNGVEGHLNGVPSDSLLAHGYTDQIWIDHAMQTTYRFADAFPDKPFVFEVHEINQDTLVPATILNQLYQDSTLCDRIGLGMWWISGRTDYQSNLIDFIAGFPGDKYAQVIGRSDQLHRFKDSVYANVFVQAKSLGIRYIEPWPYEFQNNTHDSLFLDFNQWADQNFTATYTCNPATDVDEVSSKDLHQLNLAPNPFLEGMSVSVPPEHSLISQAMIINAQGRQIYLQSVNRREFYLARKGLAPGLYFLLIEFENGSHRVEKIIAR